LQLAQSGVTEEVGIIDGKKKELTDKLQSLSTSSVGNALKGVLRH
jgi:hypothetical protein